MSKLPRTALLVVIGLLVLGGGLLLYLNSTPTPNSRENVLYQAGPFRSAYSIEYEKQSIMGSLSAPRLVVTSQPSAAMVEIDGKQIGGKLQLTPLMIGSLSSGQHVLKLAAVGYEPMEVSVDMVKGFLARVQVSLLFNPMVGATEVNEKDWLAQETEGVTVQPRAIWASGVPKLETDEIRVSGWDEMQVFTTHVSEEVSTEEILRGLEQIAQEKLKLPALPYAYLVDSEGVVYEGLGVRGFDFYGQGLNYDEKVAPVLVLGQTSGKVTGKIAQALTSLKNELGQPAVPKAKLLTVLDTITLKTGESQDVALEFQNTGNEIWTVDNAILVTEPSDRQSEFYSAEDWLSPTRVTGPKKESILPGETAQFVFSVAAPYYPGEFTEMFRLLSTTVELKITVTGESKTVVEVTDTPTGYLNVRTGPGVNHSLKGTVYPGEKYMVLGEDRDWDKIRLRDGSEGWVIKTYLKKL